MSVQCALTWYMSSKPPEESSDEEGVTPFSFGPICALKPGGLETEGAWTYRHAVLEIRCRRLD